MKSSFEAKIEILWDFICQFDFPWDTVGNQTRDTEQEPMRKGEPLTSY